MDREKLKKLFDKYWILVIFLVGICVQVLLMITQTDKGSIINTIIMILFFIIIGGLFYLSYNDMQAGADFCQDIQNVTGKISELNQDEVNDPLEWFLQNELFTRPSLQSAYQTYKEDAQRMKAVTPDAEIDIENYINQELLENEISMHYLNQIPGAMTGLGILGTFLGLSIGLAAFNINDTDLSGQLEPLMNGIKVAFHTSIIGLIYSLGFNFFYRRYLGIFRKSVQDFLDKYREKVVSVNEDGSSASFIKYQQKMLELLEQQLEGQKAQVQIQNNQYAMQERLLENQDKQTKDLDELSGRTIKQMTGAVTE